MIIASFCVLKGTYKFLVNDMLCNNKKVDKTGTPIAVFAWCYFLSIAVTIYASMIRKNFLLTIVALVIELICLLFLVCSLFPGGVKAMRYMLNFAWTGMKKCLKCCIN